MSILRAGTGTGHKDSCTKIGKSVLKGFDAGLTPLSRVLAMKNGVLNQAKQGRPCNGVQLGDLGPDFGGKLDENWKFAVCEVFDRFGDDRKWLDKRRTHGNRFCRGGY